MFDTRFHRGLALLTMGMLSTSGMSAESQNQTAMMLDFEKALAEPEWTAVNDGVMGGISTGGATMKDGVMRFSGILSLENRGGFSSVRTRDASFDLGGAKKIRLRVKGDGRTYQLRLASNARYRGSRISYGGKFPTKAGEWTEVSINLSELVPSYRGQKLDGPPLDLARIEEIGILIGDKKPGPFSLEVDWIKSE